MARAASDIVARLTMNGQQFTAETNRLFGSLQSVSRSAATAMKTEFASAGVELEKIAKRAASAPRAAGGALNIDAAGTRAAAQAAQVEAEALRDVAAAAERLALKKGQLSEADSARIMGMRQAVTAADAHARAMAQEANFADMLQAELNQTADATGRVVQQNRLMERSTRGGGSAMVMAGQQAQDFFIQVGGGANIIQAFAMQASQAGMVLQHTGGTVGKVAGIINGPWGLALMAGAMGLTMFAGKAKDAGKEIEDEGKKIAENEAKTRAMEAAKAAYAQTADGLIDKIRKETKAWDEQNRTIFENLAARQIAHRDDAQSAEKAATKNVKDLEKAYNALSLAEGRVNDLRKRAAKNLGAGGEAARGDLKAAEEALKDKRAEVTRLERQASELQQTIKDSRRLERAVEAEAVGAKLAQKMDEERASAERLSDAIKKLDRDYADGTITLRQHGAESRKLHEQRERERKDIEKRGEAERRSGGTREQRQTIATPFGDDRITSGYGSRSRPRKGASANHLAIDYGVPIGTDVKAGAAGTVVSVGRMAGLGNVVIVDYGDGIKAKFAHLSEALVKPQQQVAAGQVIAKSGNTGISTGPHLHYALEVNGRPVDPRGRTVRQGAGEKAANDNARELAELRKREADQYDRVLAASQRQLDVDAESMRFLGLKLRGLDEQAAVEMRIAGLQREHTDRMAELTGAQREEQSKLHPMMNAALAVLRAQGDIYADLLAKAGDQTNLTEQQRKAIDDANTALLAQLDGARALAKTDEDRLQIKIAMARIEAAMGTGRAAGEDRAKAEARAAERLANDNERADRDRADRQRDQIYSLADLYRAAMDGGTKSVVERFRDEMKDAIAEIGARYTIALLTGQKTSLGSILSDMGATSGGGGGGLLGALGGLLGGKSKADKFAGGLMPGGEIFGATKASGVLGGLGGIGSAISSALPYAAIAMAVLPMITSLFTSPKWGSASLSLNGGVVSGAQGVGKGASQIKAATGNAGSVAEGINRLAEQLGATISSIPGVTIGSWDGKARVALTSTNAKLHSKNFGPDVLKDFGEGGEQEAIQYAIQYAFTNAALEGISQASKNIIKAGGDDVASAITKALLIEDVPKRLQAMLDPVGYEIDQFNKSWEKTIAALKEGGASAEQMAEAQKLYKMELAETKNAALEAAADLRSFQKSLNYGSTSPYSTRDQERLAAAAFKPFEEAILRGERVDQGKFTEAAQTWLDLQRQLFGSTGSFFEAMDKVQSLTNKAISDIDNAKPIRVETDPWVKATATSTQASAELLDQISGQTAETNRILAQIQAAMGGGGGFMNENRLFA
ncbi:peptidoglycan DD-metalloendopeptidase family protein [Sphingomonas sp. MG17]|uniref:Peptidoglycan DD-metalloendopeptidase family protein n=1 Tax=Sphingomonas tagetis TaxID=2949092 RepID=A0A9X2HLV5_9SPHN|nr:peptidoglycan DD-metalloendopeptidase family protein [Sphingomonas tagetis]MCP3732022.1 peptidoglycan DD-metalloendopeptidase family protein [Sphingomonas tagetis]